MATKFQKPVDASQMTHVADMPPLDIVTEGIPAQEQLELPPTAPPAPPVAAEGRWRKLAWALAGVMGLLLVVAGIVGLARTASTDIAALHMGLTPQAWQEFRADERASTTPFHMGLTADAWRDLRTGERAGAPVVPTSITGLTPPGVAAVPRG